jgi:hypothetical protein
MVKGYGRCVCHIDYLSLTHLSSLINAYDLSNLSLQNIYHDTNSPTFRKHEASNSEEIVVRELLCAIAAAYDKINVAHGKF